MPTIARVLKSQHRFAIYNDKELVANVAIADGLDEALAATEEAGFDPRVYIPGIHIAGIATATAAQWFTAWRGIGVKRDLTIRDHARERAIRVLGAFVGAWSDGNWYDLIIDAATLDL